MMVLLLLGCEPAGLSDLERPHLRFTGTVTRDGADSDFLAEVVRPESELGDGSAMSALGFLEVDEPAWILVTLESPFTGTPGQTWPVTNDVPGAGDPWARLSWEELETGFETRPENNAGLPTDGTLTLLGTSGEAHTFELVVDVDGTRQLDLQIDWGIPGPG